MREAYGLGALILSGVLMSGQAIAQQVSAPPPPLNQAQPTIPGRQQVEEPVQRDAPAPSTASVDSRSAIVQTPCALESSSVRVTLRSVAFQRPDGSPLAAELQQLLAPVGTGPAGEQPIAVVCRIRDRANQLLNDAGYVALAQIPPQEIAGGELKITVVTARIVEVRVLGDAGPFQAEIERRIDAIRALDPLNRKDAERILLLTSDVPGVDVQLSLRPAGTQPGEVIGELSVETSRMQILGNVQNFGSRQLGQTIVSARGEAYGLTGLGDRTFFAYSNSVDLDEIQVAQGGHDFALNAAGLRAAVRASLAFSNPDIPNLDLRSRSSIVAVELSQQLVRTVNEQLSLAAGIEFLDQRTRIHQGASKVPFTRDRLRVAFARLDGQGSIVSQEGQIVASLAGYAEVRKGLDVLNASRTGLAENGFSPSRSDGNPQAWVARFELVGDLKLSPSFTIAAQAFGQWANDPLLNLEEFSLGNLTYGRGYDPGSNGGDRVYAVRIEPRFRLPIPGPLSFELTGFYDQVRLYNLDSGTTERNRLIRSIGGGLRVLQTRRFVLDLLYAHPLDRGLSTDEFKPKDRFLASFTIQFHPWRRQ